LNEEEKENPEWVNIFEKLIMSKRSEKWQRRPKRQKRPRRFKRQNFV
jgi:hypothetical protein